MPVGTKTRVFELQDFSVKKIVAADRNIGQLSPQQVLVKMKAASLNYRDYLIASGLYSRNLKLPMVPLSDGAGEVVAVGSAVSRVKPGDRVTPAFMQRWLGGRLTAADAQSALGGAIDGVAQSEAVFHEDGLVKIPDHLSFEEAATLPCAALTAWNALFEAGDVKPGNSVLTLGTGGVSIFALQFAKAAGADVVVTSSSDEKLVRAKSLGASLGINYKSNPDWDKVALQSHPEGIDHVIELAGAGTLDRSVKVVTPGGHISLIGRLTEGGFDPTRLLMKGARLQGIFVGSREMFERMNRAISSNKIKPVIDRAYKIEQLPEALESLSKGRHFGKIVLTF